MKFNLPLKPALRKPAVTCAFLSVVMKCLSAMMILFLFCFVVGHFENLFLSGVQDGHALLHFAYSAKNKEAK